MPACKQNHAQAQNAYDSSENRLKRGVSWPIFPAGLEIRPHPPKGGPPSPVLPRACEEVLAELTPVQCRAPLPEAAERVRGGTLIIND